MKMAEFQGLPGDLCQGVTIIDQAVQDTRATL
jgi:hypothetical protein